MRSLHRTLFATAASMALLDQVWAEDSVWISQVTVTRVAKTATSTDHGQFNTLVAGVPTSRPGSAEHILRTVTAAVPSANQRIDQSGEGNWMIDVPSASASTVRVEQFGYGNAAGIQQAGYSHHLAAIQAGLGNDMLLTQSGDSHRLAAIQTGQQNVMTLQQHGSSNVITAMQSGATNTMVVVQTGNGNHFAATQR